MRPLLAIAAFLLPHLGQAQSLGLEGALGSQEVFRPQDIVSWEFVVEPDEASIDPTRVLVQAAASIDDDWKMYAMDSPRPSRGVAANFGPLPDAIKSDGDPMQRPPKRDFDVNFQMEVTYYQTAAEFAFPFLVGAAASDADSLRGTLTYQICSDSRGLCLPPTRHEFVVPVADAKGCLSGVGDVAGDATKVAPEDCEVGALDLSVPDEAGESNWVVVAGSIDTVAGGTSGPAGPDYPTGGRSSAFLLLAFAAGFGALLTPCVFPMLPLTVSYFTKHTASRARSVSMASLFGFAIVITFTLLGLVMAAITGAAGAQTIAANPWVNLFIALVLIGFGLSLIGFFELRLPTGLLNLANRRSGAEGGVSGVLFMALTLTLVSFSCTAPFVGGLLAAAAGGTWLRPVTGMVAFSAAFASPFVILALFPQMLSMLPRSGSWMNAVKVTLGFVEVAAAIKFLSNADLVWGFNLISRPLAIAVTVVLLAAAGLYLVGRLRVPAEPERVRVGVGRVVFGVAFVAFAAYLIPGVLGAQRTTLDPYFPPRRAADIAILAPERGGGDADEGWNVDDIDRALDEARQVSKPLFIDFTGYSCTNCRQMESAVFPDPAVADLLEGEFVRLKLYTDGQELGSTFQKYQLKLTGTVALPTYAVVAATNEKLIDRVSGTLSVAEMQAFLSRAIATHRSD